MATTNHERVGKAMDLLRDGLRPFVERELRAQHGKYWITTVTAGWRHDLSWPDGDDTPHMDIAVILRLMWEQWNETFRRTLGHAERSLVSELRDARNKWAHQEAFTSDDAYRALDSTARLLTSVSAPQAQEAERMKMELLRTRFDEQVRGERRKTAGTVVEGQVAGGLKPWREVVTPHRDVASGRYQQAEFAADLWQVHLGEGTDEYRDPAEFFRRTYVTESLKQLLVDAIRRLAGQGGHPVVQLQTNFGGGKTHSMLALYHLFSGAPPGELAGIDAVLHEALGAPPSRRQEPSASREIDGSREADAAETAALPGFPSSIRRVVLVGNKLSPGNPATKRDGTVVRTLWGELAWQLGGPDAYARIRADDENATSPGDALRELFNAYGPCLVLIDEWVAYARQLHDQSDLPGGGFETQFSFAQALTESAKLAGNCLLVISLPASDNADAARAIGDDSEVGGQRGKEALGRLQHVVGRLETSWRPASAEESFEIVRRRLFEPLVEPAQFKDRDVVARAFYDLYRSQAQEFPPECREADYERRLQAAYPIHPEVFDRLYTDWSTLLKFQRTRGVLRLMAAVIYSLWEKGDKNPLILPSTLPIDDRRVQFELTRYLSDNWVPVIEKDVDGPSSLPLRLDGEVPNLGKLAASRRVARTIYLGSAPIATAAHRGLEDRRVRLGCVMPGESPAVFGDALRRLAAAATYLYQDGPRYWYATQPTVTKLADDRAEQLRRDPDKVAGELERRVRADLRRAGDFRRLHALPRSSQDVPDDLDARLVVLGPDQPYSKAPGSPAEAAAQDILTHRGNSPRLFQNTLVFLAADQTRLAELDEAARRFLAWTSILDEQESLDLSPFQVKQAETQRAAADSVVVARLPEAYQWLLVPVQGTPQAPVAWQAIRLSGPEALAVRASRKLRADELLVTALGPSRLRMELDKVPLWRGDHVTVRQLVEDFARYVYLPRLAEPEVLLAAIRDGLAAPTWREDTFAFADGFDEVAGRHRHLRGGRPVALPDADAPGLLVRSDVAVREIEAEQPPPEPTQPQIGDAQAGAGARGDGGDRPQPPPSPPLPPAPRRTRYYGTVKLDAARVGRDAGRIAEEVIGHLAGLDGATVTVSLEIEADIPAGAPDHVVRVVTENGRALKFEQQGFEDG
ncbi:MAG: ATP-binding protein [Chloroflexi bacterium CFX6]|nr:ATP-binding protein [Chloroflexi bacterium CFX6]